MKNRLIGIFLIVIMAISAIPFSVSGAEYPSLIIDTQGYEGIFTNYADGWLNAVMLNQKYGLVDGNGKVLVQPQYDAYVTADSYGYTLFYTLPENTNLDMYTDHYWDKSNNDMFVNAVYQDDDFGKSVKSADYGISSYIYDKNGTLVYSAENTFIASCSGGIMEIRTRPHQQKGVPLLGMYDVEYKRVVDGGTIYKMQNCMSSCGFNQGVAGVSTGYDNDALIRIIDESGSVTKEITKARFFKEKTSSSNYNSNLNTNDSSGSATYWGITFHFGSVIENNSVTLATTEMACMDVSYHYDITNNNAVVIWDDGYFYETYWWFREDGIKKVVFEGKYVFAQSDSRYLRDISTKQNVSKEYTYIQPSNASNYYLVGSPDGRWGYIDRNGQEIALYKDAGSFMNGKALVMDDNGAVYMINERFERISGYYTGAEAVAGNCIRKGGLYYLVKNFSGTTPGNSVNVTMPAFNVSLSGRTINNTYRQYPLIVYNDITYFPMTYYDSRLMGLETGYSQAEGLSIWQTSGNFSYQETNSSAANSGTYTATVAQGPIYVNGKFIDNGNEEYPLLLFRDVTYFPLTWRFAVQEFGWSYYFDMTNGLVISK